MATLRRADVFDLLATQEANLINLPENYVLKYYFFHALSWPQLISVAHSTNGKLVGYVLAKMEEDDPNDCHGHVTSVAVMRQCRKLGLASKLMKLTRMREVFGAKYASLHVRVTNRAAYSLYKDTLSYRIHEVDPEYYADREDAFNMRTYFKTSKPKGKTTEKQEKEGVGKEQPEPPTLVSATNSATVLVEAAEAVKVAAAAAAAPTTTTIVTAINSVASTTTKSAADTAAETYVPAPAAASASTIPLAASAPAAAAGRADASSRLLADAAATAPAPLLSSYSLPANATTNSSTTVGGGKNDEIEYKPSSPSHTRKHRFLLSMLRGRGKKAEDPPPGGETPTAEDEQAQTTEMNMKQQQQQEERKYSKCKRYSSWSALRLRRDKGEHEGTTAAGNPH